jgi:hypothetical protein
MAESANESSNEINNIGEPKKRGRRPLTAGLRKKGKTNDNTAKATSAAPPLHISFVCNDNKTQHDSPKSLNATSGSKNSRIPTMFEEEGVIMHPLSPPPLPQPSVPQPRPPSSSRQTASNKSMNVATACSMMLAESDSDDDLSARIPSRMQRTSQEVITILGAHTNAETWPQSTSVCCWNCTCEFDSIPIALPRAYQHNTFKDCSGVFCSFNCAKRFALNSSSVSYEKISLLTLLHKVVVGHTTKITAAPPFQTLKKFGGYMDIMEYRRGFITLPPPKANTSDEGTRAPTVQLLQQRCIPHFDRVQNTQRSPLAIQSAANTYDRTKPVLGSQMLSNSMGLRTITRT